MAGVMGMARVWSGLRKWRRPRAGPRRRWIHRWISAEDTESRHSSSPDIEAYLERTFDADI